MRALCGEGSPILGNQKVVKTILLYAVIVAGFISYCPADDLPPPLPVTSAGTCSVCRCDILERKLEALADRLEILEERLGEGVTQSGASTASEATSPDLKLWNWPDGTKIKAAGPFNNRPQNGKGKVYPFKTSCANGSCRIQYWWVPDTEN